MTWRLAPVIKGAIILAAVLPAAGCAAAAAGAAAGAAGGIYLTSRGAESLVQGSMDDVSARTKSVLNEMNIILDAQKSEKGGTKREFVGKKGDLDVVVHLQSEDAKTTKVEATARKNLAEWDKDFAQSIVSRIVEKS
jgi:ABC-type glycerol-3-phosphate transport system substrate-binding protein